MRVLSVHRITIPDNVNDAPTPDGCICFQRPMFDGEISGDRHAEFMRMIADAERANDGLGR